MSEQIHKRVGAHYLSLVLVRFFSRNSGRELVGFYSNTASSSQFTHAFPIEHIPLIETMSRRSGPVEVAAPVAVEAEPVVNGDEPRRERTVIGKTILFCDKNISPYLWSAWLLTALFLNPKINDLSTVGSKIATYAFMTFFLSWLAMVSASFIHLCIERRWPRFIKDIVFSFFTWLWEQVKEMHLYFGKTVIGFFGGVILIFSAIWIHYHASFWAVIRNVWNFVYKAAWYIFDADKVAVYINEWLNTLFFNRLIIYGSHAMDYCIGIIRERPLLGLVFIFATAAVGLIVLVIIKGINEITWKDVVNFYKEVSAPPSTHLITADQAEATNAQEGRHRKVRD